MKICWDNLEGLKYIKKSNRWRKESNSWIYMDSCKECNDPYLTNLYKQSDFCSYSCANKKENHPLYGTIRSEKLRRKQSKHMKGENNPFYNKKHTKKTKKIMSSSQKERFQNKENHPNWKGGISSGPYCFEFNSKEFKDFIKERDGNICLNPECDGNYNRLCVHHIDYNKKNCELNNLITICNPCNTKANFDRKWHKAWYQAIMRNRHM